LLTVRHNDCMPNVKRYHSSTWLDYHIICWQGVGGRYVAEAKRGSAFVYEVGVLEDACEEISFAFGDTVSEAVNNLKRSLCH
jgi:hypothetical protein